MAKKRYSSKRERFLKVGAARTNTILYRIKVLGNCANRSLYDYREDEIDKIFKTIKESLDVAKIKFLIHRRKRKEKFKL